MWLEIDDDLIIGVHSDKCDNDCLWVEFDGEANPGDRWHKNKVVPQKNEVDEEAQKRFAARAKITEFYPEWKQLNILREGNERQISKMGRFIDACRDWSNKSNSKQAQLEKLVP